MKNLERLYNEVKEDLDSLDIEYGEVDKVKVNYRARSRWGRCGRRRTSDGKYVFTIEISDMLLSDDMDDMSAKTTIAHELIHTVDGCFDHGAKWNAYARKLDIFGYNIKRTTSADEKGLSDAVASARYKYSITCNNCGTVSHYMKKTKVVDKVMNGVSTCYCGRCKSHDFTVKTLR